MFTVIQKSASMTTRDGIRLDADIDYPDSTEKFPILLMRQPYGRKIASTVVYAHPIWYASHGYIVIIQDVRGRGTSEGKFNLFAHEIEDGIDTLNWASQLPNSTGKIGMYGFSYQGMTQLYAAITKPEALKTICPSMIAYDLYGDWAYENGAFCLQINLAWAIQLAAETARLRGDEKTFHQLYLAAQNLPLSDPITANPALFKELAPDSFYQDWLTHPHPDEYWQKLSPKNLIQDVDLPMLHIGGWFDPYLRGTLNLYQEMANRSQFPQHLIIGPWAHLPWGRKTGSKDYGKEATSSIDLLQIQWFDYFLKGKDTSIINQSPITLFEMGSNQWRKFDTFPDNNKKVFYLATNGLGNIRKDDGKLQKSINFSSGEDILIHDPWRPVPSLGGHAAIPAGSLERSSLDCRSDILTYTSDILEQDLSIVGDLSVEIYCTADVPSFDLCAILSEVHSDGKVYNFTQGYTRIDTQELPINIPLQATCIKIAQGNRLKLSLSAACFPAYPVNSGTGKFPFEERVIENKIITLKISCGKNNLSKIIFNSPSLT